jgi:hypothetical protein
MLSMEHALVGVLTFFFDKNYGVTLETPSLVKDLLKVFFDGNEV